MRFSISNALTEKRLVHIAQTVGLATKGVAVAANCA
jgi:hypothetical protein